MTEDCLEENKIYMATPTWNVPSAPPAGMDTPPSERLPDFTKFITEFWPSSKKVLGAAESPLGKNLVQKSLFSPSDVDKADSALVSQQKPRILFSAKIGDVGASATEIAQRLSNSKVEPALPEDASIVAHTAAVTSPVPSEADIDLGIREPSIRAQGFPWFEEGGVRDSSSGAERFPVSRAVEGQISQPIIFQSSSPGITCPESADSVEFSHVETENGTFATDRLDMVYRSAETRFPCFEGAGVQVSQKNSNSVVEKVPVSIVVDGQVTESVNLEFVAPDITAPQSADSVKFSHVKTGNGAFTCDRLNMVHHSAATGSIPSMWNEESLGGIVAGRSGALQYETNHSLVLTSEDTLEQHEQLRKGLDGGGSEDYKGWVKVKPNLPVHKVHCDMDDEANLDIFGPKTIINPVKRLMKGRNDVQPELAEPKTYKAMDTKADIDRFGSKVISVEELSCRGKKDDPILAYTCHWCQQKTVQEHVDCCRCAIRFCGMCLFNRNGEDIKNEKEAGGLWVCPKCRGGCGLGCDNCCNCGPCRRELNLEPLGCIIEPCRDSGFTNAHDYLVHQETGESADEIASRKVGRCWTNGSTSMPPFKKKVGDQDHLITLRIPPHSEVLQSTSVSGTLEDMDIDLSSERASNDVNVKVGAKRKGICFQESCIEPHVDNTSSSDNSAQDTLHCTTPTGKMVEIEALKVYEDGNSENPSTAGSCDLAHDIDIQNNGLSRKRQKKDTHPGDKWSIPSDAQGDLYTQKLKEALAEPLDPKQLSELWDLATRRKPILKLRETRGRTMHVMTEEEGLSYLDHHPELGTILEESCSSLEKLNLLRGFFFWLQHSCMDGAYKPWVIASEDKGQGDDCVVTDGPDCEVLAVVLPLDEKKDVSCLVKPIDPVVIDLDDDDVEEIPVPTVSLPTRRQAIKQSRVKKMKACINCSKEFTMEKKRQRALFESCGHIETCVSCVETLWKLDKHVCPKCGLHQANKPRSITDFAHTEGQPDIDLL